MQYQKNNNLTDGRLYLLNLDNEIIFYSLHIDKIQEKKRRIEFISRARGTYFPGKFRITNRALRRQGLELQIFNKPQKMIRITNVEITDEALAFAKPMLGDGAVIGWWSGGITSAIACRLAIEKYSNVRLVYIETGSHHPDTMRFKTDCEKWYGQEIETIQNKKYEDHLDVVLSTRYVNGAGGARCTKELKKNVRFDFEKSNKIASQVWGYEFEASEINRAIRTQEQYAYTNPLFPLIENKLSKNECAGILAGAGIDIPTMYKLGYNNNNCIGCVKGGAGYWNKIRVDFPEIFKQMSEAEREVGASCLKNKEGKIYLDELDPKAGNPTDLVTVECGIFCQVEFAHIMSKRTNDILEGKVSIYDERSPFA